MFKRLGVITLPVIVLAGMRRCPQQQHNNYNVGGMIDSHILTTSLTVLALGLVVAAVVYMSTRNARKAV